MSLGLTAPSPPYVHVDLCWWLAHPFFSFSLWEAEGCGGELWRAPVYAPACTGPHRAQGRGCWWSSSTADATCPLSQNKCFRYWPELRGSQEYGRVSVCNLAEYQAQGYCVRELQVWRPDQVSLEGHRHAGPESQWSGGPQVCAGDEPCAGRKPTHPRGSTQSHWPWWYPGPSTRGHSPGLGSTGQLSQAGHILNLRPLVLGAWLQGSLTHMASRSLVSPWANSAGSVSFTCQWCLFLCQAQILSCALSPPHPFGSSQMGAIVPETCSLTSSLPLPFLEA